MLPRMSRVESAVLAALVGIIAATATPKWAAADFREAQAFIEEGALEAAREACASSAVAGDADCQTVLGWLALQGPEFGGPEAARRWFEQAVERGHQRAMANLAFMWARGLGGPADVERAAALYRRARASAPTDAASPAPARIASAEQVPVDRLALARYRGAYAALLKLRALHASRVGKPEAYITSEELESAEAAFRRIETAIVATSETFTGIRVTVEEEQAIMLRLLGSDAGAFVEDRRTDALDTLARILAIADSL